MARSYGGGTSRDDPTAFAERRSTETTSLPEIPTNFHVIGLTLNIVGAFFIVNSLYFKRPRRLLYEYFGSEKRRPLSSIRSLVMSQVQLVIGFVFLISGYFLQLAAHIADNFVDREAWLRDPTVLSIVAILILSMMAVTLALKVCQIFWTRWTFRRILIDFFRDNPTALEKYPATLREVGDVLEVEKKPDDSVADFTARLHKVLQIDGPAIRSDRNSESASGIRSKTLTPPPAPAAPPTHPATPPRIMS